MGRRELRENIFLLLFRVEFNNEKEMSAQQDMFMEESGDISQEDQDYIINKYKSIVEHMPQIDEIINETAKGWKTSRFGKVELTIIRLAFYEMKYDEDVPSSVAINEAVELAKKYGGDETPAFVNGILSKLFKTLPIEEPDS